MADAILVLRRAQHVAVAIIRAPRANATTVAVRARRVQRAVAIVRRLDAIDAALLPVAAENLATVLGARTALAAILQAVLPLLRMLRRADHPAHRRRRRRLDRRRQRHAVRLLDALDADHLAVVPAARLDEHLDRDCDCRRRVVDSDMFSTDNRTVDHVALEPHLLHTVQLAVAPVTLTQQLAGSVAPLLHAVTHKAAGADLDVRAHQRAVLAHVLARARVDARLFKDAHRLLVLLALLLGRQIDIDAKHHLWCCCVAFFAAGSSIVIVGGGLLIVVLLIVVVLLLRIVVVLWNRLVSHSAASHAAHSTTHVLLLVVAHLRRHRRRRRRHLVCNRRDLHQRTTVVVIIWVGNAAVCSHS